VIRRGQQQVGQALIRRDELQLAVTQRARLEKLESGPVEHTVVPINGHTPTKRGRLTRILGEPAVECPGSFGGGGGASNARVADGRARRARTLMN
jgi:hypothetical protein